MRCDNTNLAPARVCAQLIDSLAGARAYDAIPASPRSLCLDGSGGKCCVAWTTPVTSALYINLADAARDVLAACARTDLVSGWTVDTLIGNTCTNQCLSNGAMGC